MGVVSNMETRKEKSFNFLAAFFFFLGCWFVMMVPLFVYVLGGGHVVLICLSFIF